MDEVRKRAELDAKSRGYLLNPDPEWLGQLMEGLKFNEEQYGYPSCPCRLASGDFELDRDIICPCDCARALRRREGPRDRGTGADSREAAERKV